MFLTISCMIGVGVYMTDLTWSDPLKAKLYFYHKANGSIALFLGASWIIWALFDPSPKLPGTMSPILKKIARSVQYFLYFLILSVPFSGTLGTLFNGREIDFYGLFTIKAVTLGPSYLGTGAMYFHKISIFFWVFFIGLHIAGALYHLFILKDGIFERMKPWGK